MQTEILETISTENSGEARVKDEHFVLKPFVQTPDAEITLDREKPVPLRWNDRWGRRCGNPAVSVISTNQYRK